jgi:carboxypeptidase D
MLLKSVVTSALLALSLGSEVVDASKHGKFGQKARVPQERAKRAIEARSEEKSHPKKDFRFLSNHTKRGC